jgi:putative membrane protein
MNGLLNTALGLIPLADWHHDGPGWWFLFPLFWIALIAGLFFLFRRRGACGYDRYQQPPRESAAELLERRFAAGEISGDEYHERRSVLDPPSRP